MPRDIRLRPSGLAAVLALTLLAWPAGADDPRGVDVDRERSVTHNDDGSVTIDKSWEKTRLGSGATAAGSSSKTVTRGEDGVSWEKSGERTTFDGRSFEREASGQRTPNADDSGGTFSRTGTTTRLDADGNVLGSRSSAGAGSWERNRRGGRNVTYDGTTTNSNGRSSQVHREGQSWRGEGGRGHRARSERTFDDGSSVKRGRAGRTQRDGDSVSHQSRRRVRRDR
jgi:predicted dehydrogenase